MAINGVCLTATEVQAGIAAFDLVAETRTGTNLGQLRVGDWVNVERSLRIGDEVGGHLLSGHIATVCEVRQVHIASGRRYVTVAAPERWAEYLMAKGFVALSGVSLTIAELDRAASTFGVSLIPETLSRTTFAELRVGDELNLEVDAQTQAIVETVRAILPEVVQAEPR